MDSTRQHKVSRLLLKELSTLFQREGKSFFGSAFVTITDVKVSPDLAQARVYLSLFQVKDKETLIEQIRKHTGEVRYKMGTVLKNQLRHVPEFSFFVDDSMDYAENIDKLFKTIQIPPEEDEQG
jgi:ribosome-binding factor A